MRDTFSSKLNSGQSALLCLTVYRTLCTRLATLKVDEILSIGAKETLHVEIPCTNPTARRLKD